MCLTQHLYPHSQMSCRLQPVKAVFHKTDTLILFLNQVSKPTDRSGIEWTSIFSSSVYKQTGVMKPINTLLLRGHKGLWIFCWLMQCLKSISSTPVVMQTSETISNTSAT